jgi:acyl-CoA hydrolase
MEVGVEVQTEDPRTGERRKCCDAFLTFVALGPDKRPTALPPLAPETPEERRREHDARVRRDARLALRAALLRRP